MAVTKIWARKGGLKAVGDTERYASNPEKTQKVIENVLDYAANTKKTEAAYTKEELEIMEDIIIDDSVKKKVMSREAVRYVTALNCSILTARDEMVATKKRWNKIDGIEVFHGIQSFKPGEIDADTAHEIGVKLATELWGDRFQVIVATHLDQAHIHNHFVLNSVSFVDGLKFYDTHETYYGRMRKVSDRLCMEYGLSVIPGYKGEHYAGMHRAAWKAAQEGRTHINSFIQKDVDEALAASVTLRQFTFQMNAKGYDFKNGMHPAVRPKGRKKFVRLDSWFGDAYSKDNINKRILMNYSGFDNSRRHIVKDVVVHAAGDIKSQRIVTGLGVLYAGYRYRITSRNAAFIFREDIRKMDEFSMQQRFMGEHRIKTLDELEAVKEFYKSQLNELAEKRNSLRVQLRSVNPEKDSEQLKEDIKELTDSMRVIRKKIKTCDSIAANAEMMKQKIKSDGADEKERQEVMDNGRKRTGR